MSLTSPKGSLSYIMYHQQRSPATPLGIIYPHVVECVCNSTVTPDSELELDTIIHKIFELNSELGTISAFTDHRHLSHNRLC
jgi:hypothetical protein